MNLKLLAQIPSWEWPEDTESFLLEILSDPQGKEGDRILASELTCTFYDSDQIMSKLLEIIQSEEEPELLRVRSAIALGPALEMGSFADYDFDDDEELQVSEKVYNQLVSGLADVFKNENTPKEVRRRVLEASVRAPQEWHSQAIRTFFASKDEDWKLTAVFCMAFVEGFEDEVLGELGNENPEILYEAVRGAGNWSIDAAWRYLKLIAMDSEANVDLRLAAIDGLTSIRPDDSMPIFLELSDSNNEDISEAAHEAMAMEENEDWTDDGESEFF